MPDELGMSDFFNSPLNDGEPVPMQFRPDRGECFECADQLSICLDCGHSFCRYCDDDCPYCAGMARIPVLCKLCREDTGQKINPRDEHAGHLCDRCYDRLFDEEDGGPWAGDNDRF